MRAVFRFFIKNRKLINLIIVVCTMDVGINLTKLSYACNVLPIVLLRVRMDSSINNTN